MARKFIEVTSFFDTKAVEDAIGKAAKRVLSRVGFLIRRRARQSIKPPRRMQLDEMSPDRRKKYRNRPANERPFASAKPGRPPRNQTGLLKRTIFFWYDAPSESVFIGPSRLYSFDRMGALEHGGLTQSAGGKLTRIHAHPFIGPALDEEVPKLDEMWRNSVRGI